MRPRSKDLKSREPDTGRAIGCYVSRCKPNYALFLTGSGTTFPLARIGFGLIALSK
jgi:hypothetical protein